MFMGYSGADNAISWRNAAAVTSTRLTLMVVLAVAMAAPCGWGGTFVLFRSEGWTDPVDTKAPGRHALPATAAVTTAGKAGGDTFDVWCGDLSMGAGAGQEGLELTTAPMGGSVEEGSMLELEVGVANATGIVTYQWVKDTVAICGETNSSYVIDRVDPSDSGYYSCVVEDASKAVLFSPPAVYRVEAFESLPTMGVVGLCIVVAICILAGALVILRRGE